MEAQGGSVGLSGSAGRGGLIGLESGVAEWLEEWLRMGVGHPPVLLVSSTDLTTSVGPEVSPGMRLPPTPCAQARKSHQVASRPAGRYGSLAACKARSPLLARRSRPRTGRAPPRFTTRTISRRARDSREHGLTGARGRTATGSMATKRLRRSVALFCGSP
jgi:hypothetical protein